MRASLVGIVVLVLSRVMTGEVEGCNTMGVREDKMYGRNGYEKAASDVQGRGKAGKAAKARIKVETGPEADDERLKMKTDYLHLYDNYMAGSLMDPKTGQPVKMQLGALQKLMMDFSLLDEIDNGIVHHSKLPYYLPEKDAHGNYPETWLYWRTLDENPEIQDGPDGPISAMFYNSFWQGVVIKICGDARTKCLLAPRNHLKSTCGQLETQFRILRNPSDSHVIRTARQNLAKRFLRGIAKHWKSNAKFRSYWGNYVPEKREGEWSTEQIQLFLPVENEVGNDPTLTTVGNATEATGEHFKTCTMDDVVAEKNSKTPDQLEATRDLFSAVNAQRGGGNGILADRGTRWSPDDAHGLFIGKPGSSEWEGSMSEFSCLFMATALDGDTSVTVAPLKNGLSLTQLGYGKPIWDGFPLSALQTTRSAMPSDKFYYGQYFNQFYGTAELLFDETWITDWSSYSAKFDQYSPEMLCEELRLNVFIACDTSKMDMKQTDKLDRTAVFVLGQTPDKRHAFFLDGICERLPMENVANALVDIGVKWQEITRRYPTGTFAMGFEKTAFTTMLGPLIRDKQRSLGITYQREGKTAETIFPIRELSTGNDAKWARIHILVQPYADRRILWPKVLKVRSYGDGAIYDLREILKGEFLAYNPAALKDDLIDAHAYAWGMTYPIDYKAFENKAVPVVKLAGTYDRKEALRKYDEGSFRRGELSGGMGV